MKKKHIKPGDMITCKWKGGNPVHNKRSMDPMIDSFTVVKFFFRKNAIGIILQQPSDSQAEIELLYEDGQTGWSNMYLFDKV